jgi:uncharacterized protein YecA (UPF0149 family)
MRAVKRNEKLSCDSSLLCVVQLHRIKKRCDAIEGKITGMTRMLDRLHRKI